MNRCPASVANPSPGVGSRRRNSARDLAEPGQLTRLLGRRTRCASGGAGSARNLDRPGPASRTRAGSATNVGAGSSAGPQRTRGPATGPQRLTCGSAQESAAGSGSAAAQNRLSSGSGTDGWPGSARTPTKERPRCASRRPNAARTPAQNRASRSRRSRPTAAQQTPGTERPRRPSGATERPPGAPGPTRGTERCGSPRRASRRAPGEQPTTGASGSRPPGPLDHGRQTADHHDASGSSRDDRVRSCRQTASRYSRRVDDRNRRRNTRQTSTLLTCRLRATPTTLRPTHGRSQFHGNSLARWRYIHFDRFGFTHSISPPVETTGTRTTGPGGTWHPGTPLHRPRSRQRGGVSGRVPPVHVPGVPVRLAPDWADIQFAKLDLRLSSRSGVLRRCRAPTGRGERHARS